MIELKKLSFYSGKRRLLDSIDLNIQEGEIVALVGRGGAGKTVLLRTIFSSGAKYEGSMLFDGVESSTLKKSERPRLLAASFGDLPENRDESVYGFINIGRLLFSNAGNENREIDSIIERFDLEDFKSSRLGEVPGSVLKKAVLAHTFARSSKHLLLDNPDSGLDLRSIQALQKAMLKYTMNGDCSILFASTDLNFAFQTADRVVAMDRGREVVELNSANVTSELIKKLFGAETMISRNVYSGKIEIHPLDV